EIIYVEAQGDIANDLLKDTTLVEVVGIDVNGSEMPATRLIIELVESDVKSGTYRGKFKIASDPYTQSQQARAFYEEDYYVQRISTAPKLAQDFAPILDAGVPISDPYLALFGPQNAGYFIIRSIISPAITYGDTNSAAIDASPIFNVFPNPWKRGNALYDFVEYKGTIRNGIRFTGLSNDATIKIYDIAGRLVFSSPCESGASQNLDYGQFLWTGINNDGKQVSSGIYIYTTRDRTGEIRKGKIAILK
ncbi:MAG TPA: hypothetical protein PLJ38_06140, partial [bacterium]|nr:hypothetical protein [bacterium]